MKGCESDVRVLRELLLTSPPAYASAYKGEVEGSAMTPVSPSGVKDFFPHIG